MEMKKINVEAYFLQFMSMTYLCKEYRKMENGHYFVQVFVLIYKNYMEKILILNIFNMKKNKNISSK